MKYAVSSITLREMAGRRAKPPRKPLGCKPMENPNLTPRDLSLIIAVRSGDYHGIKQMAPALGLAESTVKNDLQLLYNKIGLKNRSTYGLAIWANRHLP